MMTPLPPLGGLCYLRNLPGACAWLAPPAINLRPRWGLRALVSIGGVGRWYVRVFQTREPIGYTRLMGFMKPLR